MLPRTMRGARTAAVASLLCAALVAGTGEAQLSGTWKLDEDHSDNPMDKIQKPEQRGGLGRAVHNTTGNVSVFGVQVPIPRRGDSGDAPAQPLDSAALARSGYLLSVVEELEIRL